MHVEEFAETLAQRLHDELDGLTLPDRGWTASRADLRGRIRRRRGRQAVAAAAGIAAVAVVALLLYPAGQNPVGRHLAPAVPASLRPLATRSFGGEPPPAPAALIAYGDGQLFAVVNGQRLGPVVRLDPGSLRVTGTLQAAWGTSPVYGDGAMWTTGGPNGGQLWRIDPLTMRISRRITVGLQITALAFGDGRLWLTVCSRGSGGAMCQQALERIDPITGDVTGTAKLPINYSWVDLAAGRVILVSGQGSPVVAIDPRTLAILQTFHVNGDGWQGATGVAVGPDGLYAVSDNRVARLNLTTGRVIAQGPWLPFGFAGTLTVTPGSLWLGTEVGTFRLNPLTLAPTAREIAPSQALAGTGDTEQVLCADGSVYVSYSGGLARSQIPAAANKGRRPQRRVIANTCPSVEFTRSAGVRCRTRRARQSGHGGQSGRGCLR